MVLELVESVLASFDKSANTNRQIYGTPVRTEKDPGPSQFSQMSHKFVFHDGSVNCYLIIMQLTVYMIFDWSIKMPGDWLQLNSENGIYAIRKDIQEFSLLMFSS